MLHVEDDDAAAEAIGDLLRYYGVTSRRAASLFEASRELSRWRPAVALIDLGLPDGNGVHLIRRIRSSGAATKIGVITNAIDDASLDRVRATRPDALFAKPILALDVVKWVRQTIELSAPGLDAKRRTA